MTTSFGPRAFQMQIQATRKIFNRRFPAILFDTVLGKLTRGLVLSRSLGLQQR